MIVAPDMLESQSTALKTRIIGWFPKKFEPKMAGWVGAQGQITSAKMREDVPPF